jgi:hypothetical protein
MTRNVLVSSVALVFALGAFATFTACSPTATEKPVVFADIPAEPAAGGSGDKAFGLDRSQEGVVVPQGLHGGDGGVAWCTTPSPEKILTSADLSPTTTLKVFGGGCVPPNGYYRACDDAGLPVYTPTCDAANTGKRLAIETGGHTVLSIRADAVEVIPGPLPDGTWALGPTQRAVLVNTDAAVGSGVQRTVRVAAVSFKTDDWRQPAEDFAEIVPNPKNGTFTFWRKALCIDSLGCVIARWEASKTGLRVSSAEKDLYNEAKTRIRAEIPGMRDASPLCPMDAVLAAAKVYTLGQLSGTSEKAGLKEFDGLVAGLSTRECPPTMSGKAKPVQVLRGDIAAAVRKLLASKGAPPSK